MKKKQPFALWIFVLAALALVIFSVQNAHEVDFKFFIWKTRLSLSILLIVALLIGLIAGALFSFRQTGKNAKKIKDQESKEIPDQEKNKFQVDNSNEKDEYPY